MNQTSFRLFILTAAVFLLKTVCARKFHRPLFKENEERFYEQQQKAGAQAVTFTFAKHFQNLMVLQQEPARANIYGFSPSIGQTVNAQLVTPSNTYTYSTTVQQSSNATVGIWTVELDAQNADTPANISVTSQGTTLALTAIIFGDVWICSGQSNTQFSVSLRFYEQEKRAGAQAVTFTFAKHFQNHMVLQQEPARANIYGFSPSIGQTVNAQLITPTRTYTYSTTVQKSSNATVGIWTVELDAQNADTPANISVTSQGSTLTLTDVIFGDVWICSGQSNMQFTVHQMNDSAAEKADVNYPNIRIFTVRNNYSNVPLDDLVGVQQAWTRPNSGIVDGFSAVCWVYGKNIHKALGHAIGLIHSSWGGTKAEAWSSPVALAKCGNLKKMEERHADYNVHQELNAKTVQENQYSNSALWNSMIHPLLKTSIKGAIWYQGENDVGGVKMDHYNCTFPTMISDWRLNFHQASNSQTNPSFPFGFVQLAPNANVPTSTSGFPDIRWHQTADIGYAPNPKMPNTFMAVAIDLPDFSSMYGSIHPRDKKDVADRLTLGGLAIAYGRQEVYQGPFPSKAEVIVSGFKITYGSSSNLEIRNVSGFELLCSARWAAANITSHDTVSVTLQNVCHPNENIKAVRYIWRESPCSFKTCAVYGTVNSLPAPPFILAVTTDAHGHSYFDFDAPVHI